MAIIVECDRCHKSVKPGDSFRRGFVIEREYCKRCSVKIDNMLKKIDDLHDDLAEQWEKGLAKIRKDHNVDGGLLPDVSL